MYMHTLFILTLVTYGMIIRLFFYGKIRKISFKFLVPCWAFARHRGREGPYYGTCCTPPTFLRVHLAGLILEIP
ncbi:uncharacterized protein F4822DRAFT_383983 [Hypoxylon trugodes]|uniref:uncharacterized protein n=1 Tax=Hypoxylon trugodes TaxID=326681 RepID=UPI0021A07282|nr:uncharacterized protein F4822DRAFT_383983 [Hypoxylon trugodes]KAI1393223.1 hypothetical protein F4822DRAFT_383983 [Hypoxylon trugodes]